MKQTILLVEDDERLSEIIADFLLEEGFAVEQVYDGAVAVERILDAKPDLVILDLMLPNVDGVEICRLVRRESSVPIMLLTAAENEFAELSSLNYGADTYLSKPIKPQILLAHARALLRRSNSNNQLAPEKASINGLEIDFVNRDVRFDNQLINFTDAEFDLLSILFHNAGNIMSRDDLYQETRGFEYDGLDRALDLSISKIRRKLGDTNSPNKWIRTVRNRGYMFVSCGHDDI